MIAHLNYVKPLNDKMKNPKYREYRDFLNDENFIKWQLLKTKELTKYWTNYEKENPECREALREAIEKFKITFNNFVPSDDQYNLLLENIRKDTIYRKRKIKRLLRFTASAACLIIFIASSLFVYFSQISYPDNDQILGEINDNENIQFISPHKSISFSQDANLIISKDGNAIVSTKEGDTLEDMNLPEKSLNKLIVPYGKRSSLILADGTKVWLNSGTEVEFPSTFSSNTRDITVRGEIYIEVIKDNNKPFFIHTSNIDIQVVGTKFNVSAYKDDITESVVLVEGKIIVKIKDQSSTEMLPNDMLVISPEGTKKNIVNVDEYITWKDGILFFNKATLSDILNKVGRYYNVSFENNDQIEFARRTYSGKLILSDNIDEVLSSVSAFSSTVYTRENNKILIKNK